MSELMEKKTIALANGDNYYLSRKVTYKDECYFLANKKTSNGEIGLSFTVIKQIKKENGLIVKQINDPIFLEEFWGEMRRLKITTEGLGGTSELIEKKNFALPNGDKYYISRKVSYKGECYFLVNKIASNGVVGPGFVVIRQIKKEDGLFVKQMKDPIFLKEFWGEIRKLTLSENTIITLDNDERYWLKAKTVYGGRKYYICIGIEGERVIPNKVKIVEEEVDLNLFSIYVKENVPSYIRKEVARYFLPHLETK